MQNEQIHAKYLSIQNISKYQENIQIRNPIKIETYIYIHKYVCIYSI